MTTRNPWIDPRVSQVRTEAMQAYLLQRGWVLSEPIQPHLLPFDAPQNGEEATTLFVPTKEQARDYRQRVIELITDLALFEDRYAGDVLNDLLRGLSGAILPPNGTSAPTTAPSKIRM